MLCKVLVSLDLSNMYVSLTTLRTFSEKENGERGTGWVMFVVFVTVKSGEFFLITKRVNRIILISDSSEAERINSVANG